MNTNQEWRKSSYSGGGANNCVELAINDHRTGIRNSKAPSAGTLTLGAAGWRASLAAFKAGQLAELGH